MDIVVYIYVQNHHRHHQPSLRTSLDVSPLMLNTLSGGRTGIGDH